VVIEISKRKKKITGIWFFGLAGVGKTLASQICHSLIDRSFLIDGDDVRKFISFDLGYSESDREVQIKRVLGLAEISIKNDRVPVVSTVTMSKEVYQRCNQLSFEMAHIIRPIDQLRKVRDIYETEQNVVGVDIQQKDLGIEEIYNYGDPHFEGVIKRFVE
jgi:adenylylsulfate kinase-like enzyme